MVVHRGKGCFDCGWGSHTRSPSCAQHDRGYFGIGMKMTRFGDCALAGALTIAMGAGALGQAGAGQKAPPATEVEKSGKAAAAKENKEDALVIEPAELPGTYPHGTYQVFLGARGNYVPVLRWSVASGALPPGITLDDNGVLHGEAERAGGIQVGVVGRGAGEAQQMV